MGALHRLAAAIAATVIAGAAGGATLKWSSCLGESTVHARPCCPTEAGQEQRPAIVRRCCTSDSVDVGGLPAALVAFPWAGLAALPVELRVDRQPAPLRAPPMIERFVPKPPPLACKTVLLI
jgi:hypothetical protein